jgi:AraC family transcriptional regulator, arabinose operon regulatory protein
MASSPDCIYDSAVTPPFAESPSPLTESVLTGHFHESLDYGTHRSRGTTDFLLILTAGGSGLLSTSTDRYVTTPGTLTLYRPGTPHDYRTTPPELMPAKGKPSWELLWAHFHPRGHWLPWLDWPRPLGDAGPAALTLPAASYPTVRGLLRDAHAYASGPSPMGRELALCCIEQVLLHAVAVRPTARMDTRVAKVAEILTRTPERPLDIHALARSVSLSPSRFAHIFREHTGLTPLQFHERLRIDLARRLLRATSQSVKEVSAACGFASPFYFSLRFKKATGKSPSAWRDG